MHGLKTITSVEAAMRGGELSKEKEVSGWSSIYKWLTVNDLGYNEKVQWMAICGSIKNFINWGASCIGIRTSKKVLQLRYKVR